MSSIQLTPPPPVEAAGLTATMRRYGGDWQPLLREFADAVAALGLPDTAWAVLSCPIDGMDLEPEFVALIDRDGDGRVRADDVREAVRWTASMLSDWDGVTEGSAVLRGSDLSERAASHHATATALAAAVGMGDEPRLTLTDLRDTDALCQCGDRDGDGVVPVSCMPPDLQEPAAEILAVCRAETDRNGKPGVTKAVLDNFADARDVYLTWKSDEEAHHPWGESSLEIADDLLLCDASVRAWFALCELASVDPAKAAELELIDLTGVAARDPAAVREVLDTLPLAPPRADGILHFDALRPSALREPLRRLRGTLFDGGETVTAAAWAERVEEAEAVKAWHDQGAALPTAALGAERLARLDDGIVGRLRTLCELDERNKQYFVHLQELEKLLIYQRDLFEFCRNFVALTDLIDPERRALFERGSLVMAGRVFQFAMRVRDLKHHKERAKESSIFVLYIQVSYRWNIDDEPKLETVAVPVTRGTREGLRLHRRGIFIDRGGRYHEAVVIDLVENPVSMTEALLAPFERIGQYLSGKLEKLTENLEGDFDKRVTEISSAPAATAPAAAPAAAPGLGMNPLMGGTLAFAALGSAFAFITKQLSEIGGPRILLALVVVSLLVAVPAVLLAAMRLYRRNLAGLISASGWALNDRMRLTGSLGRLFTRRPPLPAAVAAQTHDLAFEQLKRIDPSAVLRDRAAMALRWTAIATMTTLLLTIALPGGQLPWLDLAILGAAAVHVVLLLGVLIGFTITRRFRAVYWWPILTAFPVAILVVVYYVSTRL